MKAEEFWDEDAIIKDLLFQTNMSIAQIANEIGESQAHTSRRIKQLGLSWVKRNNRKLSRGHAALLQIMQSLLPGVEVITEHPLGERLRLDIYCDKYKLGAEYHGRQHFFYSNLFYNSVDDFEAAKQRDERKLELCKEQGIALIVLRFTDNLDYDTVFNRMIDAIRNTPHVQESKPKNVTFKGNLYYEKAMAKKRELRKQQYREYKKWKQDRKQN